MTKTSILCPHCGAVCKPGDGICPGCWKKLSDAPGEQDGVIDGYNRSDWVNFIGKKADRYVTLFEKHEGQKVFVHFNWAACLFGVGWMFYRKMYKYALITYVVSFLVTAVFMLGALAPHVEELREIKADIAAYELYDATLGDGVTIYTTDDPAPEVAEAGLAALEALAEIQQQVILVSMLSIPLQCVLLGLFGDLLYREHVRRNITLPKAGGTSWGAWLTGRLVCSLIDSLALSPLFTLLTTLLLAL